MRADFVSVQPGFLQLFLTQTLIKCTSFDPSMCVVYFSRRFTAANNNWINAKRSGLTMFTSEGIKNQSIGITGYPLSNLDPVKPGNTTPNLIESRSRNYRS